MEPNGEGERTLGLGEWPIAVRRRYPTTVLRRTRPEDPAREGPSPSRFDGREWIGMVLVPMIGIGIVVAHRTPSR